MKTAQRGHADMVGLQQKLTTTLQPQAKKPSSCAVMISAQMQAKTMDDLLELQHLVIQKSSGPATTAL